jgi:2,3-bisphosphoglycerate-independent phosphoglycerate mutase
MAVGMDFISELSIENDSKLVLLVADGLGGLHSGQGDETPLEYGNTPNLDALAYRSSLGQIDPISPGVTPGSGPAHLALFGYDPVEYGVERGALSAAGVDFPMEEGDIAARANFATVNPDGNVIDRRAGRIPTEKCTELCAFLEGRVSIKGVELFVKPEKEHRAAVVFRGKGLSPDVCDTDPQGTGIPPVKPAATAKGEAARKMAKIVTDFSKQCAKTLEGEKKANYVLLRGLAGKPSLPSLCELYKLHCCAVATYPMYRGLARLVGMDVQDTGSSVADEFRAVAQSWAEHTYFFVHVKGTDSAGEDGDFDRRVRVIEEIDEALPALLDLKPDVLVVTGDHSTPAILASHSWHPVPLLLHSRYSRHSRANAFNEIECARGNLGRLPAVHVMPLMLANGKRLQKFGA